MRIFWRGVTFLIITFFLVGCTIPNKITIHEMVSFEKTKEKSKIEITDEGQIKVFTEAVKGAKKEPGAVDIIDPDYKFEYGKKSYFLWNSSGSGTIMKTSNTSTTYTLKNESSKQVYEVIQDIYNK